MRVITTAAGHEVARPLRRIAHAQPPARALLLRSLLIFGLAAPATADPVTTLHPRLVTASANDTVWALVAAGGTVYAGGEFTSVNSTTRNRLARLDAATGALDAAFVPSFTGGSSPSVCALLLSGARLHVGGTFTTASGMAHQNLAAVDATSGAVVPAFTGEADGRVAVLTPAGSDVLAAGEFDTIGGLARRGVARLDATTDWGAPPLGARPSSYVIEAGTASGLSNLANVGTGPFQFRIEAGTAPGLANLANVTLATNSLEVPGVPTGVYYLRVRAVGAGGVGPVSNE